MSRHPRPIGYAEKLGAKVTISQKDRSTLGRKLQTKPLPPGAWDEIEEITSVTSVLFDAVSCNTRAPSFEKKLRTLAKHAKSVKIAITGPFSERDPPPSTLRAIYTNFFEVPDIGDLSDLNMLPFLIDVLDGVHAVCTYAIDQLRQPNSPSIMFPPSKLWDMWVVKLTAIMKRYDLPRGASKGKAGANPFIDFVWELQRYLPKACQKKSRDKQYDTSMAHHIARARRAVGRK